MTTTTTTETLTTTTPAAPNAPPIEPIAFELTADQFAVVANALKQFADERVRGAKVDESFYSHPLWLQRRIREKSRSAAVIRNLRKSFVAGVVKFSLSDVSVVIGARDAGSIVSKLRFFARQLNDWGHCPTWARTIRDVVDQFEYIRRASATA